MGFIKSRLASDDLGAVAPRLAKLRNVLLGYLVVLDAVASAQICLALPVPPIPNTPND